MNAVRHDSVVNHMTYLIGLIQACSQLLRNYMEDTRGEVAILVDLLFFGAGTVASRH